MTVLLCLAAGQVSYSQDTSKQQQKKDKLEREISILDGQIKETTKKSNNAQNELKLVRKKVSVRKQLVSRSNKQIASLETEIKVKKHAIDSLQSRLDTMEVRYAQLVRKAYILRDSRSWYIFLLASKTFPQASRRYAYMKKLAAEMASQNERITALRAQLNEQKHTLEDKKGEAQKLKAERQTELKKLQKDEKSSAALVAKLKKDKATYQAELRRKKKQVDALNREIKNLIAAAVKAGKAKGAASSESSATATGKKVSSELTDKLSAEFAANRGKLPWPVDGSVIDHFGQHYHPVYTKVKLPFNNGVSIAVNPGAKAKAVFGGTVQQVIVMPGYNQCVLVQHGEYFTFYCKLKTVAVKAGDQVKTGQLIGTVDTIAGETQMHFQLWQDTTPQDPETWLR